MARKSEVDSEEALREALREDRALMRKAVHRVELAEEWAAKGEKIDPKLLSVAWHYDRLLKEARAKKRRSEAERIRDASAVAIALGAPLIFESSALKLRAKKIPPEISGLTSEFKNASHKTLNGRNLDLRWRAVPGFGLTSRNQWRKRWLASACRCRSWPLCSRCSG